MFSVADKKLKYCKEHWIDIAIILLPFISFLRSLRIVRATRVARLARVEQLVRMSRLYRLRGLAMRALRAMLLLKLLNRLFRIAPDKQLRRLREELREQEADIRFLKHQIAELERVDGGEEGGGGTDALTTPRACCPSQWRSGARHETRQSDSLSDLRRDCHAGRRRRGGQLSRRQEETYRRRGSRRTVGTVVCRGRSRSAGRTLESAVVLARPIEAASAT